MNQLISNRRLILILAALALSLPVAMRAQEKKPDDGSISLFNGKDTTGWKTRDENDTKTWTVVTDIALDPADPSKLKGTGEPAGNNGILFRQPVTHGTDLYTEKTFGDCEVHVEFMVPKGSNSGVYLMGQYECQVFDSFGKPDDKITKGDCAAVYGIQAPSTNAAKAPGEWQTFDIIFRARASRRRKENRKRKVHQRHLERQKGPGKCRSPWPHRQRITRRRKGPGPADVPGKSWNRGVSERKGKSSGGKVRAPYPTSAALLSVAGFLIAFTWPAHLPAAPFSDPAPPTPATLPSIDSPLPSAQPELTFHAPPKPLPPGAVTQDWPCFLGPNHNAISDETKLLKSFPKAGPALVWESTKGQGYSAPAVLRERLILFHRVDDQEIVECLHADTGQRFWKFSYPSAYVDRYGYCSGPRLRRPVIDTDRIYTLGAEGKLHCLKLATGQVLWKRDLAAEFKLPQNFFGVGATPLIDGDLLILNVGAPNGPCVAGLDKLTGKMLWGAGDKWGPSYASPIPATVHGQHRVFVFAGGESRPPTGGLLCIDPSNGHVDFEFPWRSRRHDSVNASSPLIIGDQVFISECYGTGGALLDIAADGSFKETWTTTDLGTHFMTAIHKDGFLYGVDGHGPLDAPLVCVELKTGKTLWRAEPDWSETVGERASASTPARSSLLQVDGRCLCLGEYGHLAWLDLNPSGYKELDRTWLFAAEETWTLPALSRGLLYICQNTRDTLHNKPSRLLCYDLRATQ